MLVISFSVECRLEQQRCCVPVGVYLLIQCIQRSLFLAPDLGLRLPLHLAFGILRSRERCQGAGPQVVLRDMPIASDTAVIVRLWTALFPGHCATPFVVRQMILPHVRALARSRIKNLSGRWA